MAALAGAVDLPPPAYSEQGEYDRKTATAIELSVNQQQPEFEEEWEEWDDAKFEEAARRTAKEQGSTSRPASTVGRGGVRALPSLPPSQSSTPNAGHSTPQAPPLDKKKSMKAKVPPQSTKPKPSWYEEAGLGGSSSSSSTTTSSSSNAGPMHHLRVHNYTPQDDDEDDSDDSLPPPFTPTGPPLDHGIPVGDVVTLSYRPSNPNSWSRLGPPPSPPPPSTGFLHPVAFDLPGPTPSVNRQPQPFRVEPLARPRSATAAPSAARYANLGPPVRMGFDPSIAYGKTETLPVIKRQPASPTSPVDVLSLYNSSVSAVLAPPSQRFSRPQPSSLHSNPAGSQDIRISGYSSPPVSPRPMYAGTPPPNINATQFPVQPSFSGPASDANPHQYQMRWATSEQQFSQFG